MKRYTTMALALLGLLAMVGLNLAGPAAAQGGEPTPFYQTNDDPALNAQMDHVEQATSILRDLEPLEPVTRAFLTREALLVYLVETIDRDYPPQAARDDAIFYHAFGLMDLDVDLRQLQLDVLAEQIAGFYDPEIEAMFVISETDELDAMNQVLYAHEYTHVLQDQYYDLIELGLDDETLAVDPDGVLALQALVEGDAMLMTEGFQNWLMSSNPGAVFSLLGEALLIQTDALFAAPAIVQNELMFPYTVGRDFVYTLFVAGEGWTLVDEAYADPPSSTEQIIHPERYVGGDAPIPVTVESLAPALSDDYRLVWDRTLGEFYLREHLRAVIPRETADTAAAGWGGDRYHIYFSDATEETVMVWRTVWDSPADAAEFAAAYRGYGALRFDDPGVPTDDHTVCWYRAETLCLRAGEHESVVILVPDRALIADVLPLVAPAR